MEAKLYDDCMTKVFGIVDSKRKEIDRILLNYSRSLKD